MLKCGCAVQTDTRDHKGDPGGRQHRRSFSLAFSFNDSTIEKRYRKKWDEGVKKEKRSTAPF